METTMTRRILAVDDSDDMLTILSYAFEHEGYEFAAAHSQSELFAALAEHKPDLVVLDLMLPGANGYQAIEGMRQSDETRDIPVIVITAKSEVLYRRISADLGVAGHLTKPFHPDELIGRVRAVLATPDETIGASLARP